MLIVLVCTIPNSKIFLLKKMQVAANAKVTCIFFSKNIRVHVNAKVTCIFFSKNIRVHAILNDKSFKDMLTNYIISFEQQLIPRSLEVQENKTQLYVLISSSRGAVTGQHSSPESHFESKNFNQT